MKKSIILLSVLFILFMAGLFIFYLIKHDTSRWQVALGGIFVSSLPLLLLKLKKNPFNIPIIIGYYIFIFCTIFLGSIASFYLDFKWWDSTVHGYKGVLVAFIGISLYKLFLPPDSRRQTSKWILFLFVLSFSVTSSVLWEIYEFLGDLTFTHTMQRGGNTDTMYDLLCGTAGGVLIAIYSSFRKEHV
jgi:hypothetical protein